MAWWDVALIDEDIGLPWEGVILLALVGGRV